MIKYFSFLISLVNPFGFIQPCTFMQSYALSPSIVAMAPPPGDIPSKMVNSAATPSENCRQTTTTQYNKDGSKEVTTTLSCSKKQKYDKDGNLVHETDTSKPKYQAANRDFFGGSSKQGSSSGNQSKKSTVNKKKHNESD